MKSVLAAAMVAAGAAVSASAYEKAFPPTAPGVMEIKTLPPLRVIAARAEGPYFGNENSLFRRLFSYIRDRKIAMTTPVETEVDTALMRFFAGADAPADLTSGSGVHVESLGERRVASAGARGAYSERNVRKTLQALKTWLAERPEWIEEGPVRVAYWDGPFVPWFLKKYEVHIPVRPASEPPTGG